jgi:TolA-binding protein
MSEQSAQSMPSGPMQSGSVQSGNAGRSGNRLPFDMRALIRLAVWGCVAATAMGIAVIAAYSSVGTQRMTSATAAPAQRDPITQAIDATTRQSAQTAEETRRLADAVRTLSTDREQLARRVASLERGLDDVTGSIQRASAAAAPATAQPPTSPASQPPAAPVSSVPPAGALPQQTRTEPPARAPSQDRTEPGAKPPVTPAAVEAPPAADGAAAQVVDAAPAEPPTSSLGVDVGGAVNIEGLRTLWFSTRRNGGPLPDELTPLIAIRENSKTRGIDLRLIIGPFSSTEMAARLCATLLSAHHYCQPVAYEGQRLSLAEPPPRHHQGTGP